MSMNSSVKEVWVSVEHTLYNYSVIVKMNEVYFIMLFRVYLEGNNNF